MKCKYTVFSECGQRRNNQDYWQIVEQAAEGRSLFVVCDGMGGHSMGEVASETVGKAVCDFWNENIHRKDTLEKVKEGCQYAFAALNKRADELHQVEMGTTLVLASVESDKVTIAHCGDSRCYLLRPGESNIYRTKDHVGLSFGWEVVTNCFFSYHEDAAVPEVQQFKLQKGDRLFLCTDGVYKATAPEILEVRLQDNKTLDNVVDVLKFLCEKGSDDNYTGILIQVV